jgi:SAM-dependent methyltransferase
MVSSNADRFFNAVGIRHAASEAVFIKQGLKKFGADFERIMNLIQGRAEKGFNVSPYDVKNTSLGLSLHVGEYFSGRIWKAFAEWVDSEELNPPNEVVDLGCEAGVITCFLATLWPNAKVTGIDASVAAVKCARALAEKLGLKNVTFVSGDASSFLKDHPARFDMVVATMFVHEFLGAQGGHFHFGQRVAKTVDDVNVTEEDAEAIGKLSVIAKALTPEGAFISLDRIPLAFGSWWYAQALAKAGLMQSPSQSHSITAKGPAGDERFPLTVAYPTKPDSQPITVGEIISLASFSQMPKDMIHFKGDLADTFIRSLGPKEVIADAECVYHNGSGTWWVTLAKTETFALMIDVTSGGHMELTIASLVGLGQLAPLFFNKVSELEEHCDITWSIPGMHWLSKYGIEIQAA